MTQNPPKNQPKSNQNGAKEDAGARSPSIESFFLDFVDDDNDSVVFCVESDVMVTNHLNNWLWVENISSRKRNTAPILVM